MAQIATINEDFEIQLPPDLLESFPPGTKVTLTIDGNAIRVSKLDAFQPSPDPE